MTARRGQPVDEATLLGLLIRGDLAGFAKLTGTTVQEVERMLDPGYDPYDELDDEEDEDFFEDEDEDEDEMGWRSPPRDFPTRPGPRK
jgi:hypothetical protein